MNFKNIFKYTWTTEVSRSREEIIESIESKKDNYTWSDAFFGRDISKIKIKNQEIEIVCSPGPLTPFKPFGTISIILNEKSSHKTELICEVLPMNNTLLTTLYFFVPTMCLWSIGFLVTSPNLITWLSVAGIWIIAGLVIFIKYRHSRSGLIEYIKRIVALVDSGL